MDFLGNESLFEGLYDDFKKLFVERNIEYIDFMLMALIMIIY